MASGETESGPWSAWAYHSVSGPCLEIRASGHDDERLCGLTPESVSIWRPDAPEREESFLAGTVGDRDANSARLMLADGSQVEAEVTWPDEMSGLGFFAMSLQAGAHPEQLDILASDGSVLIRPQPTDPSRR